MKNTKSLHVLNLSQPILPCLQPRTPCHPTRSKECQIPRWLLPSCNTPAGKKSPQGPCLPCVLGSGAAGPSLLSGSSLRPWGLVAASHIWRDVSKCRLPGEVEKQTGCFQSPNILPRMG